MYKIIIYKVSFLHKNKIEFISYTSLEALSDFILMLSKNGDTLINVSRKVKVL